MSYLFLSCTELVCLNFDWKRVYESHVFVQSALNCLRLEIVNSASFLLGLGLNLAHFINTIQSSL